MIRDRTKTKSDVIKTTRKKEIILSRRRQPNNDAYTRRLRDVNNRRFQNIAWPLKAFKTPRPVTSVVLIGEASRIRSWNLLQVSQVLNLRLIELFFL